MNATLHGISLATFHQWLWRHVQQGLARTCRRALPVWLPSASRIPLVVPWQGIDRSLGCSNKMHDPVGCRCALARSPLVADMPWQGVDRSLGSPNKMHESVQTNKELREFPLMRTIRSRVTYKSLLCRCLVTFPHATALA
jgi:hypothetical protein